MEQATSTTKPPARDGTIDVRYKGALGGFRLDVAFSVPARGVTAIFGPSGSGKTSVLRCIAGLSRVEHGLCRVDGDTWQDASTFRPPHRRPIGYVFQEASLFAHLSVRRNLLFGAGRTPVRHGPHFDDVVSLLGLERLIDRAPHNLSGGERQRVAIGRALLSQPRLLLMDEPLSSLDRSTKDEILPYLERLQHSLALPMLYVSHDLTEVERLADTLVLMDAGRVVASGPLGDLQTDVALPLARGRDAAVVLDARIESFDPAYGVLSLGVRGGRFLVPAPDGPVGAPRRLRIVAGDVSLAPAPPGPSTILNSLPARIASVTRLESNEMIVALTLGADGAGDRLLARVTWRSWERLGLAPGQTVHAQVKGVALAPDRLVAS